MDFLNSDSKNPYLTDYTVSGPIGGSTTPGPLLSGPPQSPSSDPIEDQRREPLGYVRRVILFLTLATIFTVLSNGVLALMSFYLHRLQYPVTTPSPAPQPPPGSEEFFAIRVQYRSTMREVEQRLISQDRKQLITEAKRINAPYGLGIHGAVPELPILFLEPRPGYEGVFDTLASRGLGSVVVHVFEYRSEDHLFRIASQCGLGANGPQGVQWIEAWSSLRTGPGEKEETQCRPGGWCVVLTKGCSPGTFN